MRITAVLNKVSRPKEAFTDKEHEVLFKAVLPLKLRNFVSGKGGRQNTGHCVQQMFNMMACLKNYEFEERDCSKEITIFNECNAHMHKSVQFNNVPRKQNKLVEQPGQKNLTSVQMNSLLKKYP